MLLLCWPTGGDTAPEGADRTSGSDPGPGQRGAVLRLHSEERCGEGNPRDGQTLSHGGSHLTPLTVLDLF